MMKKGRQILFQLQHQIAVRERYRMELRLWTAFVPPIKRSCSTPVKQFDPPTDQMRDDDRP